MALESLRGTRNARRACSRAFARRYTTYCRKVPSWPTRYGPMPSRRTLATVSRLWHTRRRADRSAPRGDTNRVACPDDAHRSLRSRRVRLARQARGRRSQLIRATTRTCRKPLPPFVRRLGDGAPANSASVVSPKVRRYTTGPNARTNWLAYPPRDRWTSTRTHSFPLDLRGSS